MAIPQITNNTIDRLSSIKSQDEMSKALLDILKQSLLMQIDSKGNKKNLEEMVNLRNAVSNRTLDTGIKQEKILELFDESVKRMENQVETYHSKGSNMMKDALDDILDSVPSIKSLASALMSENPLIGQSWKILSGGFNAVKSLRQKSKDRKEARKSSEELLESQSVVLTDISKNLDSLNTPEEEEVKKESFPELDFSSLEELLSDIDVEIYKIRKKIDILPEEEHSSVEPLSVGYKQPFLLENKEESDITTSLTNSSNHSDFESVTKLNHNSDSRYEVIYENDGIVVEKLETIDDHIQDGISDVIKFLSLSKKREKQDSQWQRLKDTDVSIDPSGKKLAGVDRVEKEDGGILGKLFGMLGLLRIGGLAGLISSVATMFLNPLKNVFTLLTSFGSSIVKFIPVIARLAGKVAIIGTVVTAVWDFVKGFEDTFKVFENQDEVTLFDRILYAKDNIIAGFVKLLDNILGWFGLNFLDDETTQEDITKSIFEFRQNFMNSIKAGLNSMLDWLSNILPEWAVPDFRFDTDKKLKFTKGEEPPKRILNESLSKKIDNTVDTASSWVSDKWQALVGDDKDTKSNKFNSSIKNYQHQASQIQNQSSSKAVVNSGNTTNIVNNNGNNSKQQIRQTNTSNPDMSFRAAFGWT